MNIVPLNVYSLLSVRQLYSLYQLTFVNDYSFSGETHNFWELGYVMQGTAFLTQGDKVYKCSAGDLIICEPNVFHNIWLDNKIENNQCELFMLSFDGTGLTNRLSGGKYILADNEKFFLSEIIKIIPDLFEGYNENEFSCFSTTSSPDDLGYQVVKNCLELLFMSLIRREDQAKGIPTNDKNSTLYAKIIEFLQNNIEQSIMIEDISDALYESPTKIKEIFHLFTGGGIIQYFNKIRCDYIMKMLCDHQRVKDISVKMNFSSPYYLSYFFKRETGMTPREYMNSLKNPT